MASKRSALTVDKLWQLERIGALSLAPDGRHAVCETTRYLTAKRNTALWLLPTDRCAARRLTWCGDRDAQPAWSPQGATIAFIARRAKQEARDATPQLYSIAGDGGEARRVSDFAPGVESFKWMPDGRRIAFASWVWPQREGSSAQARAHKAFGERKETGYATGEAFYRHWDHNIPQGRVLHLLLLDLANGRVTDLFEGTRYELPRDAQGNSVYDVSPDGRHIAFVHDPAPQPLAGNRLALAEVEIGRRRIRRLVDDPDWDFGAPRYSPDGERLAAVAAHVGRQHTALSQLVLVELGGRRRWQPLGNDWDHSIDAHLRWAGDGDSIYLRAQERGRCHLWRYSLADAEFTIAHAGGWVQDYDVAGDVVAVAVDNARQPVQVMARSAAGRTLRLERFNDRVLAGLALGEVREATLRGARGDEVQVWLTLPGGFSARRRHAVVQVIHGGPHAAAGDTFSYRWNPHVFAAPGQVVAQVNYHGSSGFGWAFRHSIVGHQGELELQDIEAATDWLLAQPWVDSHRLFAAGGSYGGFLVAWMNGHLPAGRYRAFVCHAGVFDRVASFSADSYAVRPKDLAAKYWEDLPRVLAQSPATFAGAMATPTLVIHGAKDFRVPDHNGLAYYNTLKARGVDARLLWFADENHWVLKPANAKLWYAEFQTWLDAHCGKNRRSSTRARSHAVA
jgi:dipeptidyl aminopeptidase/acylaminoacyl peptidase